VSVVIDVLTTVAANAPQWIAAIGGAGGLGIGAKYLTDRRKAKTAGRKSDADTTRILTDTALTLIEPLERAINDLRTDLERSRQESIALRDDVQALHEYITVLIKVIEDAGLPVPRRPDPPNPNPRTGTGRRRNPQ
jgi:hypothetical protein